MERGRIRGRRKEKVYERERMFFLYMWSKSAECAKLDRQTSRQVFSAMQQTKRIVLTGGGSAGHVTPNLALVPRLRSLGYEVHYIGGDGIEKTLVENMGDIPFYVISTGKLRRYFSMKNFTDPFRILKGIHQSKKLMKEIAPSVVFSKGGFVSVPVIRAAASRHIPVVLHESDATLGLANRISLKKCSVICTSFEATAKALGDKGVYTGSPLRDELFAGSRRRGAAFLGFDESKPTMMVMGGSLGCAALNDAIKEAMDDLLAVFQIVHIRGKGNLDASLQGKPGYRQFEYIYDQLPDVFALSDIALSRAGANAIFEFIRAELPAVLVPLPGSGTSRGDQVANAKYFGRRGCFEVIEQERLTPQLLVDTLRKLYVGRDQYRRKMRSLGLADANGHIIQVIQDSSL